MVRADPVRDVRAIMGELAATGLTPEQIALVMELTASVATEARPALDRAAENKRAYDRDYRRKSRTKSYDKGDTNDPPPNDIYSNPPRDPQSPTVTVPLSEIEQVVAAWNEMAKRTQLATVRTPLEGARVAKLRARLRVHGLKGALDAIAAVERSPWCRGEVKEWKADFKFFLQPESFTKLLEGGFDPKAATPIGRASARPMNAAEIRSAIAFAEDHNDPDRAAELKRQLAAIRSTGPPGQPIANVVAGVMRSASAQSEQPNFRSTSNA